MSVGEITVVDCDTGALRCDVKTSGQCVDERNLLQVFSPHSVLPDTIACSPHHLTWQATPINSNSRPSCVCSKNKAAHISGDITLVL